MSSYGRNFSFRTGKPETKVPISTMLLREFSETTVGGPFATIHTSWKGLCFLTSMRQSHLPLLSFCSPPCLVVPLGSLPPYPQLHAHQVLQTDRCSNRQSQSCTKTATTGNQGDAKGGPEGLQAVVGENGRWWEGSWKVSQDMLPKLREECGNKGRRRGGKEVCAGRGKGV